MFTTDNRTENFLTQMGVAWKYTNNIRFNNLMAGWETRNLARPVPIREEAVEEYAALTQSGSAAPGPILHETSNGMDVLDGVQRLAASQLCNETTISAYVIKCDSLDLVTAIKVMANARLQGRAEPLEWTRRRAVDTLVVERGMSVQEVAKLGGWRIKDIEQIASATRWRKAIDSIGGPDNLSDAMLSVVSDNTTQEELCRAPEVMAEFFSALKQSNISATDAQPYVEEFFSPIAKQSKCYMAYKDRLKTFTEDPEIVVRIKGRKGCTIPHDVNLRRSLRAVIGILDEIRDSSFDVQYIDEFFQMTKQIHEKLHDLSDKHKKATKARVPADMYQ